MDQTTEQGVEEQGTGRGLLRLAGAAVVGGAAASMIGAQPAAATTGNMQFGADNDAGEVPTALTSSATGSTLIVQSSGGGFGVEGRSTGDGVRVYGKAGHSPTDQGWGVFGSADNGTAGYGLVGHGGQAQLYLIPEVDTVAPTTGLHEQGEIRFVAGGLFACVVTGTPGTWRKIAGPASAGAFHAITPTRVYDSRAAAPTPGPLAVGQNRLVSVADGRDSSGTVATANLVPAGATAVAANITVTATVGAFGYLAVNPGGNTTEGASTINWSSAGQTIANGVTLTLNNNRELTVICNGIPGGSTHLIIDIAGYYL